MPVIAIAGAIGATALAGSAVAATVGGIAAISAVTAFEIVAAVGATIGAIGVVTKDKTLSMVGLAIGAIGGIGGLASSAGLFGAEAGSGASIFGGSASSSGSAFAEGLTPATAGSAAGEGFIDAGTWGGAAAGEGGATVADAASGSVIDSVASGFQTADTAVPAEQFTGAVESQNATDPAAALAAKTDATADILKGGTGTTTDTSLINPPPPPPSGGDVDPITGKVNPYTGPEEKGIFGKIVDYAGAHPVVALGALQAGGSLLSGLTSTLTPAQVSALNAQAAANQAAANLATQQTQNLALPKAVASSAPVTGSPQPIIPQQPAGLINRPLAPVTGVPP